MSKGKRMLKNICTLGGMMFAGVAGVAIARGIHPVNVAMLAVSVMAFVYGVTGRDDWDA